MCTEKYQTYDDLFVYYYLKMLCQTLEKKLFQLLLLDGL